MITCGLVGLFVAVAYLALIAIGKNHYSSLKIGQSMGLVAFSLMLVVAAVEAHSGTETAFAVDTFNGSRMNLIALAEVAAAFLITQADFMRRLGIAQLTAGQWGSSFSPPSCCSSAGRPVNGSRARRRRQAGGPAGPMTSAGGTAPTSPHHRR